MSAALRRSFASLELRNYRLYFTGQVISLAGNWMQIVAELWLILQLTDSGVYVGLATALQFAGILVFGALGGALADRFDKRKLLMVSQTGMAVPALILFALAATGAAEAWMVLLVIALRGLVLAVDNPARQAFVIEIVGPDRVVNAVGLNSVLVHSARITGPAIAGVIIALWGVAPAFGVNALSFVAMLVALWLMDPAKLSRPDPKRTRGGVREAISYVRATPELRVPLLLMLVLGTFGFNFQVIIPLLAERTFDGNVSAYSLLMIAMGVGSIAGALTVGARQQASKALIAGAAARLRRRRHARRSGADAPARDGRARPPRARLGHLRRRHQLRPAARRRPGHARPRDGALLDRLPRLHTSGRPTGRLAGGERRPEGAAGAGGSRRAGGRGGRSAPLERAPPGGNGRRRAGPVRRAPPPSRRSRTRGACRDRHRFAPGGAPFLTR